MKAKIILLIVLAGLVGMGSYIYSSHYKFFKYLPAVSSEQVKNFNGKLYDENEKLFSGRIKEESGDYTSIYSYKNGELHGLNVSYYKNNIKEIGHWKDGKQNGLFQLYTEEGILVDDASFKNGERDGLTEQFYSETGKLRVSGNYKNGILEGKFKAYYPNGNLQGEVIYKNGEIIEEQIFNPDGTPYNEQEEKIIINGTVSDNSDEITIREVSDDEIIISENSDEDTENFSKGMEEFGKEMGNYLNSMLEAAVITNLAYVDLMSFENIEIPEENLVFNENEKVPFKRSCKDGVYGVNIIFENNTYLWVELKENAEGKHRLFTENYEEFKKIKEDKKINLEEFIFPAIDDYYKENNKPQKFFDITVSVKNHS